MLAVEAVNTLKIIYGLEGPKSVQYFA